MTSAKPMDVPERRSKGAKPVSMNANNRGRIGTATTASGARTAESIRGTAVELFFRHGYEATSLREVAAAVGIQVGSLYNHIPSKEQLLYEIMSGVIEDLLAEVDANTEGLTDPIERLRAMVSTHVLFHAERSCEVFVGNSELRSLSPEHREAVVALRDQYEHRVTEVLASGAKSGSFDVPDIKLLSYAIVSIGTQVSSWYQAEGRYKLHEISDIYADFILRGLIKSADDRARPLSHSVRPAKPATKKTAIVKR